MYKHMYDNIRSVNEGSTLKNAVVRRVSKWGLDWLGLGSETGLAENNQLLISKSCKRMIDFHRNLDCLL